MEIKKLLPNTKDLDHPVAYYPALALVLGNVKESLFLCQLIYWLGREGDPDNGIFKTQAQLRLETGLSDDAQRTARRGLRQKKVLTEQPARLQGGIYYKVDPEILRQLWAGSQHRIVELKEQIEAEKTSSSKRRFAPSTKPRKSTSASRVSPLAEGKKHRLEEEAIRPLPKAGNSLSVNRESRLPEVANRPFAYIETENTTESTAKSTAENTDRETNVAAACPPAVCRGESLLHEVIETTTVNEQQTAFFPDHDQNHHQDFEYKSYHDLPSTRDLFHD